MITYHEQANILMTVFGRGSLSVSVIPETSSFMVQMTNVKGGIGDPVPPESVCKEMMGIQFIFSSPEIIDKMIETLQTLKDNTPESFYTSFNELMDEVEAMKGEDHE